ncbi:MAG: DUF2442 domain-containing protein [Anaerolineae bacterium]|nr:DUF2442 domain-containing protein [Anaerolineae bacterium]
MGPLVRASKLEPREGFVAHVTFDNGEERDIDLEMYLHGPIFQPLRDDPALFRSMRLERGVISWPNGADIDPDTLYYNLTPGWMMDEDEPDESISHTQLNLSMADILQAIHALSLSDKAMVLSILSDEIADAVERLETQIEAQRPEPALAVREEGATYAAGQPNESEGEHHASHRE